MYIWDDDQGSGYVDIDKLTGTRFSDVLSELDGGESDLFDDYVSFKGKKEDKEDTQLKTEDRPVPKKGNDIVQLARESFKDDLRKRGNRKEYAKVLYGLAVDTGLKRNAIIDIFMSELDISRQSATTYYYNFTSKKW